MPPERETVAEASLPPLHDTSELSVIVATGAPRSFTETGVVATHPFESVTVTVYPPAEIAVAQLLV